VIVLIRIAYATIREDTTTGNRNMIAKDIPGQDSIY